MNKTITTAAAIGSAALLFATSAFAAIPHTLFGQASYVTPGNNSIRAVEMVSDTDPGFGGVSFEVEEGMTFTDLEQLSTDFMVTEGACGGGSPRFQVRVFDPVQNVNKNIFVYLGDAPNYTCLPDVWISSGDLLETGKTIDTSQLTGGTFYDPYDTALIKYGEYEVTAIRLVTDAGWAFNDNQVVHADNVMINDTLETFEPTAAEGREMCKKDGWKEFDGEDGMPGPFINQGQCVSYFSQNTP